VRVLLVPKDEPITSENQRKRVLVIDDDKSVLNSSIRVLERNGFDVDTAETGKEAIEKSKTQHYDVALVDLKLPDMDGIEILSKAHFQNTVKIMLTGYPSLVTGMQAMDKGVDAYLHKPVRPEELILLVKSKLASQKKFT
jgi:DNA-binding response OmpR family regulator